MNYIVDLVKNKEIVYTLEAKNIIRLENKLVAEQQWLVLFLFVNFTFILKVVAL